MRNWKEIVADGVCWLHVSLSIDGWLFHRIVYLMIYVSICEFNQMRFRKKQQHPAKYFYPHQNISKHLPNAFICVFFATTVSVLQIKKLTVLNRCIAIIIIFAAVVWYWWWSFMFLLFFVPLWQCSAPIIKANCVLSYYLFSTKKVCIAKIKPKAVKLVSIYVCNHHQMDCGESKECHENYKCNWTKIDNSTSNNKHKFTDTTVCIAFVRLPLSFRKKGSEYTVRTPHTHTHTLVSAYNLVL